jgi:D-beta-D-heptose 7-phosphate kinase/D-beta-D-heptose 1-phosphate adenosyltransferase
MKIGLIGDFIEDIYVYGNVSRISPESPIPIFEEKNKEAKAGGAGNVKANLEALGSKVVSYFGHNSQKTRFVCDNQIVFRSDKEEYIPNFKIDYDFTECDIVVLSDYNKGFLDSSRELIDLLKYQGKFVIVDPKSHLLEYYGADIVKLNLSEFAKFSSSEDLQETRSLYNIGTLIVTRGSDSVLLVDNTGVKELSTKKHQVSDVTGAGDVFIAALAHYLSLGLTIENAAEKATTLASISVTKFGTYILSEDDIRSVSPKVVFTNGCFDILHRGHIDYLKKSRALGDKLIVGINSDESVRRLKGLCRPINLENDRKYILESLDCVDEVIIFDEDTPYDLIKKINPSIITKGGDYKNIEDVVGHDIATVLLIPFVEGYSTTKILEKLS